MKKEVGKSYLTEVPHEGNRLNFRTRPFRGYLESISRQIKKNNKKRSSDKIRMPTSSETISLVYDAFKNPKGKDESRVIRVLNNRWLWGSTGNFGLPKSNEEISNGIIIRDTPSFEKEVIMDKDKLLEKLEDAEEFRVKKHPIFISPDRSVRFVPRGFSTGEMDPKDLEKNPFMVATYLGRKNHELENSSKAAEIASKYKGKPILKVFDSAAGGEKIGISALYGIRGFGLRFHTIENKKLGGIAAHTFPVKMNLYDNSHPKEAFMKYSLEILNSCLNPVKIKDAKESFGKLENMLRKEKAEKAFLDRVSKAKEIYREISTEHERETDLFLTKYHTSLNKISDILFKTQEEFSENY